MDFQILKMILQIMIFLPLILLLIYIFAKYGGNKIQNYSNGKLIKIIERVAISKDNQLLIVQMGDKIYLMASSQGRVEILEQLKEEELDKLKSSIAPNEYSFKIDNIKSIYKKLSSKKEDWDEKK